MGESFKKIGVRTLLLITKSFVYLWERVGKKIASVAAKPTRRVAEKIFGGILILLSPVYVTIRRGRRLMKNLKLSPAPLLRPLVHRYALHTLTVTIAIITLFSNLAGSVVAESIDERDQLILELVESDESFELVGLPSVPDQTTLEEKEQAGIDFDATSPLLSYEGDAAFQPYLPTTGTSNAPRHAVEEYIVEDGDTLAGIAANFRLKLDTLLSSNNLSGKSIIRPGQKLSILPVDGLVHVIKRGENIGAIASRYSVSAESILSYNSIADARSVVPGQTLVVPGGKAPAAVIARTNPTTSGSNVTLRGPSAPTSDSGAKLIWPTASRRINQYFTWRHSGLDIDGDIGSPIYAAESGVVTISGWGGAYGNTILIRHDNGLVTRYGHHSKNLVGVGERVERGQLIALMGSTGRSTGPHLHFEVISGNTRVNPFGYTR